MELMNFCQGAPGAMLCPQCITAGQPQGSMFSFVIKKFLVGRYFETIKYPISHHTH